MQPDSTTVVTSDDDLLDDYLDENSSAAAETLRRRAAARQRKADVELRIEVLGIASVLTVNRSSADAVKSNARPILAWIEKAPTSADRELRRDAVSRQRWNEDQPDDDPARFLAEAGKLHAFIDRGQEG